MSGSRAKTWCWKTCHALMLVHTRGMKMKTMTRRKIFHNWIFLSKNTYFEEIFILTCVLHYNLMKSFEFYSFHHFLTHCRFQLSYASVLRPTFSSNDSPNGLRLCYLILVAPMLACLVLHRVIFWVSWILLITSCQGLPIIFVDKLFNKLMKKCFGIDFFKLARSLNKSMACVNIAKL